MLECAPVHGSFRRSTRDASPRAPKAVAPFHQPLENLGRLRPKEKWPESFVAAHLLDGRWFRVLIVVDRFTREAAQGFRPAMRVGRKAALRSRQFKTPPPSFYWRWSVESVERQNPRKIRPQPTAPGRILSLALSWFRGPKSTPILLIIVGRSGSRPRDQSSSRI
jgi:hypothetical protein